MSFFSVSKSSSQVSLANAKQVAYFYAALLVVFSVAQLFTFDEFIGVVASFGLPGGNILAHVLAILIVTLEVMALPFLLRMPIRKFGLWVSMVFSWLVPVFWLFVAIWILVKDLTLSNVGLLGGVVDVVPGWWLVFVMLAVGVLAGWSAWGLGLPAHVQKKLQ